MKNYKTSEIRNIVLLGHSGSGKTTLAEAMAFEGKVIDRRGSVEAENTLSDYSDVEHLYKRSIFSTMLYTEFMNNKLNIIDAPGSDDFCGSLFSAFKVADTGILVVNATAGVEVGTEIHARYASKLGKPLIAAVNQLDNEKANWESTVDSIKASSELRPVLVQYPVNAGVGFDSFIDVLTMKMYKFKADTGERTEMEIPAEEMDKATELHNELVEAAAENEEVLMEKFFEEGTLPIQDVRRGLKLGIARRGIMPIFCLSARKDIGVKRLMEFVINSAPAPADAPSFVTVEGKEVKTDSAAPTTIFIYKTSLEQHIGEVCYFRVVSGRVTEGQELVNQTTGNKEKISQLFCVAGRNRQKVTELEAGDVGCTVKLKGTKVSHTLAQVGYDCKLAPIEFPAARYRCAIRAKNTADDEKLGELLNRAAMDDPSILVEYSKELKQIIMQGQGEHHLNILKWQLTNHNKIDVEFFQPRISYRETITKTATASYTHKKQSGGAGQFGKVSMVIEPYYEGMPAPGKYKIDGKDTVLNVKQTEEHEMEWGGKLVFCSAIVGGAIDARFMPAIMKGIMEKMEEGPLTGSRARDIRVVVYDGKMHPVDSNELSFKLAGRNAFKDAFKDAGPKIMEPIFKVEVMVPGEQMGDVMKDLQNRRAMIEGMSSSKGFEHLHARVPLAELYRYSTTLSSLTSGRATYTMEFASFEQTPADVQEKLLKAYAAEDKDE
ncbi:Translation elongation factor G-related protein [Mucinivorans hirudinis]|uniref:Elongation factor G n=1 Tax=Mucinivorans hirudinis TaxID=1433126 RepID=A0A060RDA2_9BACT|nr:Translation elongation factor G-related protein [Mucinivorans hirudinis]